MNLQSKRGNRVRRRGFTQALRLYKQENFTYFSFLVNISLFSIHTAARGVVGLAFSSHEVSGPQTGRREEDDSGW